MNRWIDSLQNAIKEAKNSRKSRSSLTGIHSSNETSNKKRKNSSKSANSTGTSGDSDFDIKLSPVMRNGRLINCQETKDRPKPPVGRRLPTSVARRFNSQNLNDNINTQDITTHTNNDLNQNDLKYDKKSQSLFNLDKNPSIETLDCTSDSSIEELRAPPADSLNGDENMAPSDGLKLHHRRSAHIASLIDEFKSQLKPIPAKRQFKPPSPPSDTSETESGVIKNGVKKFIANKSLDANVQFVDLKGEVGKLERQLDSVEQNLKNLRNEINEKTTICKCAETDETIVTCVERVKTLESNSSAIFEEAKNARDTYDALNIECRLLVEQLKAALSLVKVGESVSETAQPVETVAGETMKEETVVG